MHKCMNRRRLRDRPRLGEEGVASLSRPPRLRCTRGSRSVCTARSCTGSSAPRHPRAPPPATTSRSPGLATPPAAPRAIKASWALTSSASLSTSTGDTASATSIPMMKVELPIAAASSTLAIMPASVVSLEELAQILGVRGAIRGAVGQEHERLSSILGVRGGGLPSPAATAGPCPRRQARVYKRNTKEGAERASATGPCRDNDPERTGLPPPATSRGVRTSPSPGRRGSPSRSPSPDARARARPRPPLPAARRVSGLP